MDERFQRHIDACNNVMLPGDYLPFLIGARQVGWVKPVVALALMDHAAITRTANAIRLDPDRADDLPLIGEDLAKRGLSRFRGEMFDVRAEPDGEVLARVDRGALPQLGIMSVGVHVNGLVRREDGLHVWVGHRADDRPLDPGKLDNLVGGGVSAGMTPRQTLIKEAEEEASLPGEMAQEARPVGQITYALERGEGLRRDLLYCFDLQLPPDFVPTSKDGEVDRFELWPISKVFDTVHDTDRFKFNVNLVLIDLFRRSGLV